MSTTPKEGSGGERRRASRNPFDYLPQIGGIVTIAATIIGLVFVFRPGCTPQDVGKATVDDVRVVQPVTFVRYLQRLKLPAGTLSREQLRRRGVMIEFHYDITGFRGKKLPLRWSSTTRRRTTWSARTRRSRSRRRRTRKGGSGSSGCRPRRPARSTTSPSRSTSPTVTCRCRTSTRPGSAASAARS